MFQDQYVFSQLTAFLNMTQFNNYVRKYDGNRYVKHFTCWNQMLAMMFGQLSNRESLRVLVVAFEAHRAKQYHILVWVVNLLPRPLSQLPIRTVPTRSSKTSHSI